MILKVSVGLLSIIIIGGMVLAAGYSLYQQGVLPFALLLVSGIFFMCFAIVVLTDTSE